MGTPTVTATNIKTKVPEITFFIYAKIRHPKKLVVKTRNFGKYDEKNTNFDFNNKDLQLKKPLLAYL